MKPIAFAVTLLLSALFVPPSTSAEFKKTKIAILDFQLQGQGFETKDMGAIVAEWFITAFVDEGRFDVVERAMLTKIIDEQKLGMSGVLDEKTVSQIGKLLGVKVIISGSVMRLQSMTEINARIIDVQTASIISAESVKSSSTTQLQEMVGLMSQRLIRNFPLEGYIVRRDKNRVTLDLGRFAGVKPGMRFSVFTEGAVIKHPKTGEILDVERITTGEIKITGVQDKLSEGEIVREDTAGLIQYGQLVISITGALKPIKQPSLPEPEPAPKPKPAPAVAAQKPAPPPVEAAPPPPSPPPPEPKMSPQVARLANQIESGNAADIVAAAKIVTRSHPNDSDLLAATNRALLSGYARNQDDARYVDAMSWLCNVLGSSKQPRFKATLDTVAQRAENRKLKKYAAKNRELLD